MKKLLLLFFVFPFFMLSSCSSDAPAPRESVVNATIDGTAYIFNTVNVSKETFTEEDATYTDVTVTASIDNNPDLRLSFIVEQNVTGPTASWYFAYFLHETAYPKMDGFLVDVSESTNHSIKGTFSGQVQADDETAVIADIQNGTFDIAY